MRGIRTIKLTPVIFALVLFAQPSQVSAEPLKPPPTNPAGLARKGPQNTRTIPYEKNGVVVGLRIMNVTPESTFGRAGFLSDDVIKLLNGAPISSLSQVMDIVGANETVEAVVLRNEETIEFKFPGRKAKK